MYYGKIGTGVLGKAGVLISNIILIGSSIVLLLLGVFTNTQHCQLHKYWQQRLYYVKTKKSSDKMLLPVRIEPGPLINL